MFGKAEMSRVMAVVFASSVFLLQDTRLSAQPGAAFDLARTSVTSVHAYVASEAIPRQVAAPPNLVTSDELRQLIETMLRQSPTFRRQCLRIGAEPRLTIQLSISALPARSNIRATTQLKRQPDGQRFAAIRISAPGDSVELIAHEIEHVIEQLDGVDLAARAAQYDSGVKVISHAPAVFETIRAKRAGQKVASETTR